MYQIKKCKILCKENLRKIKTSVRLFFKKKWSPLNGWARWIVKGEGRSRAAWLPMAARANVRPGPGSRPGRSWPPLEHGWQECSRPCLWTARSARAQGAARLPSSKDGQASPGRPLSMGGRRPATHAQRGRPWPRVALGR